MRRALLWLALAVAILLSLAALGMVDIDLRCQENPDGLQTAWQSGEPYCDT